MNPQQIGYVLSDIATQAATLRRLVNMLVSETDPRDIEALTEAIDTVAGHVGMVADMALQQVAPTLDVRGGVEHWTMPPRYFEQGAPAPETVKE